jgi:hypothetical protein
MPPGSGQLLSATLCAAVLCAIAFVGGGGLSLGAITRLEIGLTIGSGLVVAAVAIFAPGSGPLYGAWAVALLFGFGALAALSVAWSVQPDASWQDAGRLLAYSAFFGASVAIVRAVPGRWPGLLGGVTLAAVVVCGYALLTKIFPAQLDASDVYARLRAPYGYWNAIGLTAAMGAIGCLWLGARRAGNVLLSALAYPAMGLMIVTVMLAYSRGALAALALGLVVWLCIVPLRLRGALLLIVAGAGAAVVVVWDFSKHALNSERVALPERVSAGHQLGVLLVVMLLALALLGVIAGYLTSRHPLAERTRRAAGVALLGLLAAAILAFAGALTVSQRGLFGSISHNVRSLTDPNAPIPGNTPGRLTALASARARYWDEALKVFAAHPALGAGAEGYATARLRYSTNAVSATHGAVTVTQAHGYIVQTVADLGVVGLILTLALLGAWLTAAGRPTHPFNRRWSRWRWRSSPHPYTPERIAMLTMLCIVVVFGIHSFVDWTWYVPGDACVALLCAGWLAGRGPLGSRLRGIDADGARAEAALDAGTRADANADGTQKVPLARLRAAGPVRGTIAAAAIVGSLVLAFSQWQPERSVDSSQEALTTLVSNRAAARADANSAVARDPLSAQALFTLAAVEQASGEDGAARQTLGRAVRLQPSNPQTWQALGEHDLQSDSHAALDELRAALYLNPESTPIQNAYVEALRATTPGSPSATPAAGARPATIAKPAGG